MKRGTRRRRRRQWSIPRLATLLELGGAALVDVGLWQIYRPIAWIWAGAVALTGAYAIERSTKAHDHPRFDPQQPGVGTPGDHPGRGDTGPAD